VENQEKLAKKLRCDLPPLKWSNSPQSQHASTPTQELSTHTLKPGTCALTLREMHQPKFNALLNKIGYFKIF